jgi:excisionase family DNA binding protein
MQRPKDEVLTIEGAAAVLDIAPRTLRRWLKEKDIPYAKLGRDIRIMRSSLMTWLRQQEEATMAGRSGGSNA